MHHATLLMGEGWKFAPVPKFMSMIVLMVQSGNLSDFPILISRGGIYDPLYLPLMAQMSPYEGLNLKISLGVTSPV